MAHTCGICDEDCTDKPVFYSQLTYCQDCYQAVVVDVDESWD